MIRNRPLLFLSLLLALVTVFLGEIGIHWMYSWTWGWPQTSALQPHDRLDTTRTPNLRVISSTYTADSRDSTKILVISDPHIQCTFNKFEPWLFRWDSDTYLQRSFTRMLNQLQPDVIVVLGDIFAEGYKASEVFWWDYLKCLHQVLPVPSEVRLVVVAGDNDIGGEGAEGMLPHINQRYIAEFGPLNEAVTLNGATLVKLNTVSYIHGGPANDEEERVRGETGAFLKMISETTARGLLRSPVIVFSHVPLSHLHSSVTNSYLSAIGPDYVFSGHIHYKTSSHHTYTTTDGRRKVAMEWTVPTSSYRMGETHMGVGAIFIDCKGQLGYSILWLPPRYPVLFSYLLLAVGLTSLCLYHTLCANHRPFSTTRWCYK